MSVAVVIGGVAGTGLRVDQMQVTEFGQAGETGATTARVRVSGATFASRPTNGQTILVGGEACIVTQASGSGILWVIDYQKVRPVAGV